MGVYLLWQSDYKTPITGFFRYGAVQLLRAEKLGVEAQVSCGVPDDPKKVESKVAHWHVLSTTSRTMSSERLFKNLVDDLDLLSQYCRQVRS